MNDLMYDFTKYLFLSLFLATFFLVARPCVTCELFVKAEPGVYYIFFQKYCSQIYPGTLVIYLYFIDHFEKVMCHLYTLLICFCL